MNSAVTVDGIHVDTVWKTLGSTGVRSVFGFGALDGRRPQAADAQTTLSA